MSKETIAFNETVIEKVKERDDKYVAEYENVAYAVPTLEHYLPLIYILGAAENEKPHVFNNHCELAAIAMTGFAFGIE